MKPVAIFRHSAGEGPGYFATFLDRHSLPWQLIRIDEGEAPPASANAFSGLCFMGGPMSVNDDLPWIPPVLQLIRDAVAADIPVLGHCLGGQLMSKALGGAITLNQVKEIGWGTVRAVEDADGWLNGAGSFLSYHWHGETFSIPQGATRILESDWCANQAFAMGPHLGLQCHVEMTESMIDNWTTGGAREIERAGDIPSVQKREQQFDGIAQKLDDLHAVADQLYTKWIQGLKR